MNPRLESLMQKKQATPTRISDGSEKVRSELVRFMSEARLNRNQTSLILGVSYSCVNAWLKRERKCPLLLRGALNFARLQCGLSVELVPPRRGAIPPDLNGQAE